MKYDNKIVHQSYMDDGILWCTNRAKKFIEEIKPSLGEDGIWVLKTYSPYVNFKDLVECLFNLGLDVFDIEFGTITRIYIAPIDSYRIQNSVVFTLTGNK